MIINIFNSKYKILDLDAKKNMGTSNLRKHFEKNHEKIVLNDKLRAIGEEEKKYIMHFVVACNLPFSIVDRRPFQAMLEKISLFDCKVSGKTIQRLVIKEKEELQKVLLEKLVIIFFFK